MLKLLLSLLALCGAVVSLYSAYQTHKAMKEAEKFHKKLLGLDSRYGRKLRGRP